MYNREEEVEELSASIIFRPTFPRLLELRQQRICIRSCEHFENFSRALFLPRIRIILYYIGRGTSISKSRGERVRKWSVETRPCVYSEKQRSR